MKNIRKQSENRVLFSHKQPFRSSWLPKQSKSHLINASLIKDGHHHAKLGEYAANLWKEKAMMDVLVVVQNQEFKAHKAVLACHSPYFKEVLVKPGFSEAHYMQLPSVTPRAFEILLEYMYTGEIKVNCQELSEVYRSARKLGMLDAIKKCIELLHVTPNNFQNMVYQYVTAQKLNLLESSSRAFKLMITHFESLVLTQEFLDLEKEQVVELFSSDEIGARSEIIIFLAALKWMHYKYLEREEHLPAIIQCIRFSLMSMQEILACYHPPCLPGIITIPSVKEALLNATCYIAAKSIGKEHLFQDLSSKPRKFLFKSEPILLWDTGIFDANYFEKNKLLTAATKIQAWFRGCLLRKRLRVELSIANNAATVIQSVFKGYRVRKVLEKRQLIMKASKKVCSATSSINDVFKLSTSDEQSLDLKVISTVPASFIVMGASDSKMKQKFKNVQNAIFSFSVAENHWTFLARCPIPLLIAKVVTTVEALYIIGGCNPLHQTDEGKMLPSKEGRKYDFITEKWSLLPFMNHPRSLHGVEKYIDGILVIGGKDDANEFRILSSIEIFDENLNNWLEFQPCLPQPLCGMGVAIQGSNLWIAGGLLQDNDCIKLSDSVWCFDHHSKRWCECPNLPKPIAFVTLLADNDRILCIGGTICNRSNNSLTSINNVYSFQNGKWIELQPMPNPYHSVIACVNERNIYVFGALSTQTMSRLEKPFYYDCVDEKWKELLPLPEECEGYVIAAASYLP